MLEIAFSTMVVGSILRKDEFSSHWCVLRRMLARSITYEVFLPPWNASAYCVKYTNVNAVLVLYAINFKKGQSRPLICLFLFFSQSDDKYSIIFTYKNE